jgi:FkbM family methyltransferase
MFKRIFSFAGDLRKNNRFFSYIYHTYLWRKFLSRYYHSIRHYILYNNKYQNYVDQNAVLFFTQNQPRLNTVVNMLADDKSKMAYIGMAKYRQTRNKKDFPTEYVVAIEYFIEEMRFNKDEVFIDCGAYCGDTINDFFKYCREYKKIIAFEPDPSNFDALSKKYGNNPKIDLINTGVYDKNGVIKFAAFGTGGSHITDGACLNDFGTNVVGGDAIQVRVIDGLNLEKVSFIKMDIEGVELNALKGAEKTILRNKPKLAICIYHSNEDMIRIAEYIHDLVPEYKLYVRQHSHYPDMTDTVLYAIMP